MNTFWDQAFLSALMANADNLESSEAIVQRSTRIADLAAAEMAKHHAHPPICEFPAIAVDFDGTICENKFPHTGPPKAGAKEALLELRRLGYYIIISSCRTSRWTELFAIVDDPAIPTMQRDRVKDMVAYLKAHDIYYDCIDDGTRGKPHAAFYIDDKAIRFNDNWKDIVEFIARASSAKPTSLLESLGFQPLPYEEDAGPGDNDDQGGGYGSL